MKTLKESNYYLRNKNKILKEFEKMHKATKIALERKHIEIDYLKLKEESYKHLLKLIPQLPYIGGNKNGQTINLIICTIELAIINSLKKDGLLLEEIGEIIYMTFEEYFNSKPKLLKWIYSKLILSKLFVKIMEKDIQQSKLRMYKEDFLLSDVDFNGNKINLGYNYLECAIYKLYEKYGMLEYLPYICLGDYAMFNAYGISFCRTQTIANGGLICDFRFKKNGELMKAWPPEQLTEWKTTIKNISEPIPKKSI